MSRGGRGRPAVFLDRDGVLMQPVLNPATGELEAAKRAKDATLTENAVDAVRLLHEHGYLAVVVSNQPDAAKGKAGIEALREVDREFQGLLAREGVRLDGVYYCYHHPRGVVPSLAMACACRKPATGLVERACSELGIDPARSWFVGDRDTDVECGRAAGCRTILVRGEAPRRPGRGGVGPDAVADDVLGAAKYIVESGIWKS